jgi:hypothetical protein
MKPLVAFAHRDRALDVVDHDGFERVVEPLGLGALGLLDRRGKDLQGLPLLTFEGVGNSPMLLLPQGHAVGREDEQCEC